MSLHDLYLYCVSHGYPEEAEHLDLYLQLQGYLSPVGRAAP